MQTIATVGAVVLMAVAAFGVVFPILPGSILGIITVLVWAAIMGSGSAWTTAIVGAALMVAGITASWVLTGRSMKRQEIPRGPILLGVVGAIIGMFAIPFFGLFIGFAVGLLLGEWSRRGDLPSALKASGDALKAMGIGIVIEFTCVCLAGSALAVGILVQIFSG